MNRQILKIDEVTTGTALSTGTSPTTECTTPLNPRIFTPMRSRTENLRCYRDSYNHLATDPFATIPIITKFDNRRPSVTVKLRPTLVVGQARPSADGPQARGRRYDWLDPRARHVKPFPTEPFVLSSPPPPPRRRRVTLGASSFPRPPARRRYGPPSLRGQPLPPRAPLLGLARNRLAIPPRGR